MLQSIKKFLNQACERCKSYREGRHQDIYTIVLDSESLRGPWLTLTNETGETVVEWTEVVAVFAFKRDCFGYDSIRLLFCLTRDRCLELSEDDEGWNPLVRQLPEYLEGCDRFDVWFDIVVLPPFETNWMQIYERPAVGNEESKQLSPLDVEPASNVLL